MFAIENACTSSQLKNSQATVFCHIDGFLSIELIILDSKD